MESWNLCCICGFNSLLYPLLYGKIDSQLLTGRVPLVWYFRIVNNMSGVLTRGSHKQKNQFKLELPYIHLHPSCSLPISSFLPIVSKSMTDMSREQSRICSQGTSNSNVWKCLYYFLGKIYNKMMVFFISSNLIECRVQITFVYRGFLLLNSLLSKHQPDLDIRIGQPVDIFGFQIACLNTNQTKYYKV